MTFDPEARACELVNQLIAIGALRPTDPRITDLLAAALSEARNAGAAEAEPRLAIAMQAIGVCSALASYSDGLLREMAEHAQGRARAVMAEWEALEKDGR